MKTELLLLSRFFITCHHIYFAASTHCLFVLLQPLQRVRTVHHTTNNGHHHTSRTKKEKGSLGLVLALSRTGVLHGPAATVTILPPWSGQRPQHPHSILTPAESTIAAPRPPRAPRLNRPRRAATFQSPLNQFQPPPN